MIVVKQVADALVIMVDGEESIAKIKELVQRATNLWPDASPEIKEFADAVTNADLMTKANGTYRDVKPNGLQNYHTQDSSTKGK